MATNKPIFKQLEKEYDGYADQLKWQLIENKIIQENEIKVENEKLLKEIKRVLKPNGKLFIAVWNKWQPRFIFKSSGCSITTP